MIGRWFRPYSLRLAVVCLPLSYLVFAAAFWGWTYFAAADTATRSAAEGLVVVSAWYGMSCYVWAPLLWFLVSLVGVLIGQLRARRRRLDAVT
ncbi:hypothetical protein RVF83_00935 [Gordonia rubripertincta]|uniref:Uncharacterized protein n=2 Tax=Gordonia rubripertincta TaxID=36822 RepID=A0AAW6R8N6_GORRU|nr:hypothetical protein [Gordonia rubripertincta]MDG6781829.1 hypothetical protein [Gordonia rubripertincta]GAB83780.1 hypothetical protein GORBP_015_00050 [Gordonia rubripertincta NBRC 101908]